MAIILYILIGLTTLLGAQRHLPQTQVFRSPGLLLLDTHAETPAVYDGSGPARLLKQGESFEIQVFAPGAAGQLIYEYGFSVDRYVDAQLPLAITAAKDWQENALMSGKPNTSLIFSSTRFGIAPLPRTGHLMTLTLTATDDLGNPPPLDITLTVTILSNPPRRVNQMVGRQHLTWGWSQIDGAG
jgi:hypothetical protein